MNRDDAERIHLVGACERIAGGRKHARAERKKKKKAADASKVLEVQSHASSDDDAVMKCPVAHVPCAFPL